MSIAAAPIQWTRQSRNLWTGRRQDAPAGTIERGARFTFVDVGAIRTPGYRTLANAQTAATGPVDITTCGPDGDRRLVHPLLFAAATAMLVLDAALVGGGMLITL